LCLLLNPISIFVNHLEGIRDEEKEQLDSILSSISTQSRNTEFILQKHFYTNGDVNYDWPYYLKAEALNVRKSVEKICFYFRFLSFVCFC